MSTERKSYLGERLKKNLAALGVFLALMAALLFWLTSGEHEKLLGKRRMLEELKEEQLAADPSPAGVPVGFGVEPLVDEEYADRLISDLAAARESVDVLMFEIKLGKAADNPANRIVEALAAAKERGVSVRVRLEQSELDKSLTRINRRTAEVLQGYGIYPEFDLPTVETHAKSVLIDGRILYVGNHNWSAEALLRNREVSIRIESPRAISTMRRSFDKFDAAMKKVRTGGL